ncbi:protoporphyrinogen oxidase-like [Ctenocephalides felis]|uniref:protoporphyrinogen oxidase-like n=1 Tax=Ctenocephalides felis TaxID=7515 RepID=UPI000E6E2B5D|nr:protoporphyrinogen oxidase-like [Ctenocephalides felis]
MPVVLGGGVSGLSAAYYLTRNKVGKVQVLEASQRVGGWIRSNIHDDFIFEHGPRTLRPSGISGKNTLKLLQELNITHLIMPTKSTDPVSRNRMIYVNKKLHKLPSSLLYLFRKQEPFTKPLIYSLWTEFVTPSKVNRKNDESIYDFAKRRFGKEVADFAISPLICGICGGDAKEISVKLIMKDMFQNEQKHGGIIKGMLLDMLKFDKNKDKVDNELIKKAREEKWSLYSLKGGLEMLPKALCEHVKAKNTEISLKANITQLEFLPNSAKIVVNGDTEIKTDHIISSLPANRLAVLLGDQHPQLSQELKQIPFVSIAVVNLEYDCEVINEKGFGFLVPPQENLPILGVIFDSCRVPTPGKTILTVMLGGRWFRKYFGLYPTNDLLYTVAEAHTTSILKLKALPSRYFVNVLDDCIPQYLVGHNDRVQRIRNYIKDHNLCLSVCGSSFDGVSVNDSILSAKNEVETYMEKRVV